MVLLVSGAQEGLCEVATEMLEVSENLKLGGILIPKERVIVVLTTDHLIPKSGRSLDGLPVCAKEYLLLAHRLGEIGSGI